MKVKVKEWVSLIFNADKAEKYNLRIRRLSSCLVLEPMQLNYQSNYFWFFLDVVNAEVRKLRS